MTNRASLYNRGNEPPSYDRLGRYGSTSATYLLYRQNATDTTKMDCILADQNFRWLGNESNIATVTRSFNASYIDFSLQNGHQPSTSTYVREIWSCSEFGRLPLEVFSDGSITAPTVNTASRFLATVTFVDSDHRDRSIVYVYMSSKLYALDRETRMPVMRKGVYTIPDGAYAGAYGSYNASLKRFVFLKASLNATNNTVTIDMLVYDNVDLNSEESLSKIFQVATSKTYTTGPIASSTLYSTESSQWGNIRPVLTNDGRVWFANQANNNPSYPSGATTLRCLTLGTGTSMSLVSASSLPCYGYIYPSLYGGTRKMQSRDGSTVALFGSAGNYYSEGVYAWMIDKTASFYASASFAASGGCSIVPFGDSGWAIQGGVNNSVVFERFNGPDSTITQSLISPISNMLPDNTNWCATQVVDYSLLNGLGI